VPTTETERLVAEQIEFLRDEVGRAVLCGC
jgi:hypothetical protein